MWKVQNFRVIISSKGTVPNNQVLPLADYRDRFLDSLTIVLRSRAGADDMRLSLANAYLDAFVTFSTLVHAKPARSAASQTQKRTQNGDDGNSYLTLSQEVPRKVQGLLLQILAAAEKAFAKRSKHKLEEEDVGEEPIDPDAEPHSDSDDEDAAMADADKEQKLALTLLAEQKLCAFAGRIVLGLWAGVLDGKTEGAKDEDDTPLVEMRLKRNHKRLGPNFKAVIDQFEANRPGAEKRKAAAKAKAKNAKDAEKHGKQKKSEPPLVLEDDDIEDDEMDHGREGERVRDEELIEGEEEERVAEEVEENGEDADHGAEEDAESVVGD
jgi:cohesin complex subunit SA-1/2